MILLFDIGGTKMRLAVSEDGNGFGEPKILETPLTYDGGIAAFKVAGDELLAGRKANMVVGGIAGPFSDHTQKLVASPNLADWVGKPFKNDIEKHFGVPVHIENDAALCGLGEAVYGAGKGHSIVSYITVSTGVGGARIVDGAIDEKSIGFEPGHQIIDADMTLDEHAHGATLQDLVSGKGVEQRTGRRPKEITDPAFWDTTARYLAYGLNNVIVQWSPDALVLGGSMITGDPAIPIDKVKAHLKDVLTIFPELPAIKKAELGDIGGLWGALAYAKNKV